RVHGAQPGAPARGGPAGGTCSPTRTSLLEPPMFSLSRGHGRRLLCRRLLGRIGTLEARTVPSHAAGSEVVNTTPLDSSDAYQVQTANASSRHGMQVVVWTA